MQHLSNSAVRTTIGLSHAAVARLAGVAVNTIVLYESDPKRRRPRTLAACEQTYSILRELLSRFPSMKKRGRDGGTSA